MSQHKDQANNTQLAVRNLLMYRNILSKSRNKSDFLLIESQRKEEKEVYLQTSLSFLNVWATWDIQFRKKRKKEKKKTNKTC